MRRNQWKRRDGDGDSDGDSDSDGDGGRVDKDNGGDVARDGRGSRITQIRERDREVQSGIEWEREGEIWI